VSAGARSGKRGREARRSAADDQYFGLTDHIDISCRLVDLLHGDILAPAIANRWLYRPLALPESAPTPHRRRSDVGDCFGSGARLGTVSWLGPRHGFRAGNPVGAQEFH